MLEGLEIKESLYSTVLSNKDERIDSQFYTRQPIKNPGLEYMLIGKCLVSSQYGISIEMNEDSVGYPIYRMNEIHDMLCDTNVDKCADIPHEIYSLFALKDRDVLFNRTNSYEWVGRTGIYYQNDTTERTFASYLVRFVPNENIILAEYLTAYLNSKYGIWDIKRRARQSINQTNVNPEEVKDMEVPILTKDLQLMIQRNFQKANTFRIASERIYQEAEECLVRELGLINWHPSIEKYAVKTYSWANATKRLDAEYFMPKYDELKKKISSYHNGIVPLCQIANTFRGDLISDTLYSSDSSCSAYIRGADISSNVLISNKMTYIDNAFVPENEITCKYGDIVFAMIGSVGTAALVTEEFIGAYVSNNLGIIRVKDSRILPEYLHLLLTSPLIGKLLFEQQEKRTAQPKISDKDIWDFPIPLLAEDVQLELRNKVKESFRLREESKRLLEVAKRTVEIAIEENEENALQYINNYGKSLFDK